MNPYRSHSTKSTITFPFAPGYQRPSPLDPLSFDALLTKDEECWKNAFGERAWTASQVTRCVQWLMQRPVDDPSSNDQCWLMVATLMNTWHCQQPTLIWTAIATGSSTTTTTENSYSLLLTRLHQTIRTASSLPSSPTTSVALIVACASIWYALDALQSTLDMPFTWDGGSGETPRSTGSWWLQEPQYMSTEARQWLLQAARDGIAVSPDRTAASRRHAMSGIYVMTHLLRARHGHAPEAQPPITVLWSLPDETGHEDEHWISSRVARPMQQYFALLVDSAPRSEPSNEEFEYALRCLELLMALQQDQRFVATKYHSLWTDPLNHVLEHTDLISFLILTIIVEKNAPEQQRPAWVDALGDVPTMLVLSILRSVHAKDPSIIPQRLSTPALALPVQNFIQLMWNQFSISPSQTIERPSENEIYTFLFLQDVHRVRIRRIILSSLSSERSLPVASEPSILHGLLHWTILDHSLAAAVLLQHLLRDRCHVVRHDELSRILWHQVSSSHPSFQAGSAPQDVIECCWDGIQVLLSRPKHTLDSNSYSLCHPLLLLQLLDILYLLLSGSPHHQSKLLCTAETLEQLTRFIPSADEVHSDDPPSARVESATPTFQNLSRFHDLITMEKPESSLVSELPVELGVPGLPWAVATLCAMLGHSSDGGSLLESDQIYLRRRLLDAAFSFAMSRSTSLSSPISSPEGSSRDLTRRRFRLVVALSHAENEEYLTDLLYASEQTQSSKVLDLTRHLDQCKMQLNESQIREEHLLLEHESLSTRLLSQSTWHRLQVNEARRNVTQSSDALVTVHAHERKKAEEQAQQMALSLTEARSAADTCRESERYIRINLQDTTLQLQQVTARAEESAFRVQKLEVEKAELIKELRAAQQSHQDSVLRQKVMQEELRDHEERAQHCEHAEMEVRNTLEIFFGDLVSLAHLFTEKEKEMEQLQGSHMNQISDLERRLKLEQERRVKLEEQDEQRQYEHSILTRKYQRAKEKLVSAEQERKSAAESSQRNPRSGPISYMNQLHATSSAATKSASDRSGLRNDADKENGSATASYSIASSSSNSRHSKRDPLSRR